MALTSTERAEVIYCLGYSSRLLNGSHFVQAAMDTLTVEQEAIVRRILAALSAVETAETTTLISSAGLKRVEDIEWDTGGSLSTDLNKVGSMWKARLASLLGVPLGNDLFSSGFQNGPTISG